MNAYDAVIGLEVHAELATKSKLFCRCPNVSDDLTVAPNTAVCPVCVGLPGALPVLNRAAVTAAITVGHALESKIPTVTKWDRKNYFYPDLPKGYQISQYDAPLCLGGRMEWFDRAGVRRSIELTRVHLEEDTGKLTHPSDADYSLIDYNRSSVPLLELVTEPVIASAAEAREFGEAYQRLLRITGVANADMEKGQMRCEANISIVPTGTPIENRLSGTKVEVKNLNSFRSLERAIAYEVTRQAEVLDGGGRVVQETRGWDENRGMTYAMRRKETSDDYRYFPDPDLRPLDTTPYDQSDAPYQGWLGDYGGLLTAGIPADAVFTVMTDMARWRYFDTIDRQTIEPGVLGVAAQWLAQEPAVMTVEPVIFARAMAELVSKTVSPAMIKQALASNDGFETALAQARADSIVDDLSDVVQSVIQANPAAVTEYRSGNERILGFLVGQVKKATGGKGDPRTINEELIRQIAV